MAIHSGRNRKIARRVKRAATHRHRSRWLRLASRADQAAQVTEQPVIELPATELVVHEIRVSGSGDAFNATGSCGEFATRTPAGGRYPRGAGTRHRNMLRETVEVAT